MQHSTFHIQFLNEWQMEPYLLLSFSIGSTAHKNYTQYCKCILVKYLLDKNPGYYQRNFLPFVWHNK